MNSEAAAAGPHDHLVTFSVTTGSLWLRVLLVTGALTVAAFGQLRPFFAEQSRATVLSVTAAAAGAGLVIALVGLYWLALCRPRTRFAWVSVGAVGWLLGYRRRGDRAGRPARDGGGPVSVLVVGLSHHTAPVGLLERAAVPAGDVGKVLSGLLDCEHVSEALVLSTCNRVEVYAVVRTFHGGLADVSGVLTRHSGTPREELSGHLYVHYAGAGVEHLFRVAAGLDSMVVGESQILGQLRTGYTAAVAAHTIGRTLHELAQQALRAGKRVHAETGIDTAGASVVSEALADASAVLGGLAGRRAVVIGAGSMGGLAAAQLRRADVAEIVIANRSAGPAERLAAACEVEGTPARAIGLEELAPSLAATAVVVSCTGSVLFAAQVAAARGDHSAPVAVCDLGLPRDVEATVGEPPGVTLVDLTTLQRRLRSAASGVDTSAAHRIVVEEVRGYLSAQRSAEVTPTVAALHRRAAEVVDTELMRLDGKLPDLDGAVRDELTRTVRRVVDKLLHAPTVRVKQLAESVGGHAYADALRELFALDPQTAAAVITPRGEDIR